MLVAVLLAVGLVIGIERGWKQRDEAEGERAAGLRTHALSGLLGGIWGALALNNGQGGVIALALAFGAFTAALAVLTSSQEAPVLRMDRRLSASA